MTTRKLKVHPGEARTIAAYLDERNALVKMLTGAVAMVCAREGIPVASLSGVEGDDTLVLDVPPDSPESSTIDSGVAGAIPVAPSAESAGNGQQDGKNAPLTPPVDPADVGLPTGEGSVASRGTFRHTEGM